MNQIKSKLTKILLQLKLTEKPKSENHINRKSKRAQMPLS